MLPLPAQTSVCTLCQCNSYGVTPSDIPISPYHRLDIEAVPIVFERLTFTFEDDRFGDSETRFVALGVLHGTVVSIIHTENEHEVRIISFRKATRHEIKIYREEINRY